MGLVGVGQGVKSGVENVRQGNNFSAALDFGTAALAAAPFATKGGRNAMFGADARARTAQTAGQVWNGSKNLGAQALNGAKNWSNQALDGADNLLGIGGRSPWEPAYAGGGQVPSTSRPTTPTRQQPLAMQSNPEGSVPQGVGTNVPGTSLNEPVPQVSTPQPVRKTPTTEPDVGLSNRGYRPQLGERSTTKVEYYGEDGAHRINRSVRKPVSSGDATELSQPGGLKATEGTQITDASGKYAGQPGRAAHPLAQHGPEIPSSQVKTRVGSGKGQVRQSTRFLDRSKMETAVKQTTDAKKVEIDNWLKTNPPAGEKFPVSHDPKLGNLGEGYRFNKTTKSVDKIEAPLNECKLVLKSDGKGGYAIQTAFPQ
jgi:Bacterial CdiA-CT RNAse A domain